MSFPRKRESIDYYSNPQALMIDSHCHLEQEAYKEDLNEVIEACKRQGLRALITVCAEPGDWEKTLKLASTYKGYVYPCASVHPIYVERITDSQINEYFKKLREHQDILVAIGETGADYFHVRESTWQKKQRELFHQHICLARELDKPVVVHCRDAFEDVLGILEEEKVEKVLMHLFSGNKFIDRVIKNGWYVSVGPILLRSKGHRKIVRDMPLSRIMLETDSPWFGVNGQRNTPLSVIQVAERIAEIKKLETNYISDTTDKNATEFFSLPI